MGNSRALARSEHAVLFVAIVAVLAAGIVAAILLPDATFRRAAREGGSLLAPPSEDGFSDAFGAPGTPSASFGADEPAGGSGTGNEQPTPSPSPGKPTPSPKGDMPPPPGDEGLLGLLPDLPIIPPPLLPPSAAARAVERVAATPRNR